MATTILDCIQSVCDQAKATNKILLRTQQDADHLALKLEQDGAALKCVLNGPAGQDCALPDGARLMTLAEAIARLNAIQINAIAGESFTATAGQTAFTLGAAPANAYAIEVALNGAICADPSDYTVAGTTLTFAAPLAAGDTVSTRRFTT